MKAIVQDRYGDESTLSLDQVELREIKEDEVLIEVSYLNITSGDMRLNTLNIPGLFKPIVRLLFGWNRPKNKVRGMTGSGTITEIGKNVTNFSVGDRVYYINSMKQSCAAEYLIMNKGGIISKAPSNISLAEASPLAFGALTAIHFMNDDTIKQGDEVLIYGASGSVGTYSIQMAKALGATVTGVSSKKNHEVLKELGCDFVIDYKETDFTKQDKRYDLIFDTVMVTKKKDCKNVLKTKGKYVSTRATTKENIKRLDLINNQIQNNKLKSYIEKEYEIQEYKEAFKHVYTGHKVGNVVLKMK